MLEERVTPCRTVVAEDDVEVELFDRVAAKKVVGVVVVTAVFPAELRSPPRLLVLVLTRFPVANNALGKTGVRPTCCCV